MIGDFGITCDLREDGFATDRLKIGTLGYYAPELMSQAAITASDYYSFGQTIWTLYSGEMMYGNILRRYKEYGAAEQRDRVNFAMLSNTYYGLDEIREDDEFLEILIRGLLLYDPSSRFGYEKVNRWLKGDRSLSREIGDYEGKKSFDRSFRLFGAECWDDEDVCWQISTHWGESIEALYDGRLKDFYASQSYETARYFDSLMRIHSTFPIEEKIPYWNDVGLAKAYLYLAKNKALCWRGIVLKKISDLSVVLDEILMGKRKEESLWNLFESKVINEWYDTLPGRQPEIAEVLEKAGKLYNRGWRGGMIAKHWLYYTLMEDRSKFSIGGCEDVESYIRQLLSDRKTIYADKYGIPAIEGYVFLGFLCAVGYYEAVEVLYNAMGENYQTRFQLLFDFFDQVMVSEADKDLLNEFYYHYGPMAYLVWWRENLDSYTFVGDTCQALRQKILDVPLDEHASISAQREALSALDALQKVFATHLVSSPFVGIIGLEGDSDNYITYKELKAAWCYRFLGQIAPVGFKLYMGL